MRTSERSRGAGASTRRERRRSATTAVAWTARSAKQRAPVPRTTLAMTSVGWCIPRYTRDRTDVHREQDGDDPDRDPEGGVPQVRGDDDRQRDVRDDGGAGVPRREARGHRDRIERGDRRTWPIDDRRRREEGGELDEERPAHEGSVVPEPADQEDDDREPRHRQDRAGAAHDQPRSVRYPNVVGPMRVRPIAPRSSPSRRSAAERDDLVMSEADRDQDDREDQGSPRSTASRPTAGGRHERSRSPMRATGPARAVYRQVSHAAVFHRKSRSSNIRGRQGVACAQNRCLRRRDQGRPSGSTTER